MRSDRTGGPTKPVETPLDLASRLAQAAKEQEARNKAAGMREVRVRETLPVLPEHETTRVASPNDRFRDSPLTSKPGIEAGEGDTPPGFIRDPQTNRLRPRSWRDEKKAEGK